MDIDFYDFVEPCEENCSPERHAYHKGQWDLATKLHNTYAPGAGTKVTDLATSDTEPSKSPANPPPTAPPEADREELHALIHNLVAGQAGIEPIALLKRRRLRYENRSPPKLSAY